MFIRNNIPALRTLNESIKNQKKSKQASEHLSSGLRINQAADDAAGLAISEGMRAQIRGLMQAGRNAKDAQSMVYTTDTVLGDMTDSIQRMRELTIQSLSDTVTDEDRMQIQKEFRQIQETITGMADQTAWNTKPVVESHFPSYAQLEGNRVIKDPIKIIDGYNNDLEIVVDGTSKRVNIPAGVYSLEEISDTMDDQLVGFTPEIIVDVTEDNTLTLQTEGASSIDFIRGGASSLFYEYTLGTPPGMIIGTTNFPAGSKLTIQQNKNDKLTFFAGSNKQYEILFPPGSYDKDHIIDYVNQQLTAKGENNVKAIPYGTGNIAITSDKYVITGLSGNMIEIDGITSVIYDIAKQGNVYKTHGYYYGDANISNGVPIKRGQNDTLNIQVNNGYYQTINLLKTGENEITLGPDELLKRLNSQFDSKGMNLTASNNSGTLRIDNNLFGSISKINVSTASPAYDTLFKEVSTYYYTPYIYNGQTTTAQVQGSYGIGDPTVINSGNNKLTMTVDGTTKTLLLEEKSYTKPELEAEMNQKLTDAGFNVKASLQDGSNGKSALSIRYIEDGKGSISINNTVQSTAYQTLFGGTMVNPPYLTSGTTGAPQYPPEGEAGDPIIPTTPATAQGRVDLSSGITLTDDNNSLSFTLNGATSTVKLANGFYTAQKLVTELNNQLDPNLVKASLTSDQRYLMLTTINEGSGQSFQSASGVGMETTSISTPSSLNSSGSKTVTSVTGQTPIPSPYTIDGTNNQLSFNYFHEGTTSKIDVTLDDGIYGGIAAVTDELNEKLTEAFQKLGFTDPGLPEVYATPNNQQIELRTKEAGSDYSFSNLTGSFYKQAMQKYTYIRNGGGSSGYTYNNTPAFIVGRETITDKNIVINPNVNDRLTFDFYKNGTQATFQLTLAPGAYNAGSLVNELNNQLKNELKKQGFPEDTLAMQIGGIESGTNVDDAGKLVIKYQTVEDGRNDTGTYRIDGVRGNAAYTFFYRAQGDPAPSFTIGAVNLNPGGATIEEDKNDTFIVDVDGESKTMKLPAGKYPADQLLATLNNQLATAKSGLIASYYEGKLKLSTQEVGQITIDSVRGNARDTLFYKTESRKDDPENTIQVGANSGQTLTIDKSRVNDKLLRINTIMIHTSKSATKALSRLDTALTSILNERTKVGAYENRLDTIIKANDQYEENIVSAESRIRDADLAKEMMEKAKSDLLEQVNQSIMGQANSLPKNVLELLK
ncbi:flagellin [Neobacillus sp. PS3-34]|uniref:flagellin n=1 Tax=Neobacillus sp. PS3-34 TaxID=3070678 RepID=UPI0027DF3184|nr:flagellin [Neobacillus sp. PS3-34]WML46894.1 flagellin [Neobacillus sp. PS3-34]